MNTFNFNIDGVDITLTGNSREEIVETLRANNLGLLVHNNFYFSKTTQQRTGDGWLALRDMNENFIVNSFAARLSETIRGMYKEAQNDTSGLANTLYVSFLDELNSIVEECSYLVDPNDNLLILQGLSGELARRLAEDDDSSNDEFDDEDDDMVSSDSVSTVYDTNANTVVEPKFFKLSGLGSNLGILDRS